MNQPLLLELPAAGPEAIAATPATKRARKSLQITQNPVVANFAALKSQIEAIEKRDVFAGEIPADHARKLDRVIDTLSARSISLLDLVLENCRLQTGFHR